MYALIRPFLSICLFRMAPQDLPASRMLLGIALTAHAVVAWVLWATTPYPVTDAFLAGVTQTVLLAAFTALVLFLHRLPDRILQTLTALAGTDALISLLSVPVSSWVQGAQLAGGDPGTATVLMLVLLGWTLAVYGHVLRHALSSPYFLGLVVALVFYWLTMNVMNSIFPPTPD